MDVTGFACAALGSARISLGATVSPRMSWTCRVRPCRRGSEQGGTTRMSTPAPVHQLRAGRRRRLPPLAASCALAVTGLVAFTAAAPAHAATGDRLAYVTNLRGNTVSVLDATTGTVT